MTDVLLYSGGLDSYALNYIRNPDKRVLFDIGTDESRQEQRLAKEAPFEVEIVDGIHLDQFALDNDIIPHRNTIMALLASNYGDTVYLGATKGDTTKDKDFVWANQVEQLLNYFGKDTHKVNTDEDEYPFEVRMPFKNLTKTEIVQVYLEAGGDPGDLSRYSRSCYEIEYGKECGECRSCIRKGIAFWLNDIFGYADMNFIEAPFENITKEVHEKMLSREGESEDYQRFLQEHPDFAPHNE